MLSRASTPEYVRELNALRYSHLTPEDLVSMRIYDVMPEYVRPAALDYKDVSADDLVSMRIHDVTRDYVKKMKARCENVSVDKLASMRIHGRSLSPAFGPVKTSESRARTPGRFLYHSPARMRPRTRATRPASTRTTGGPWACQI